MNDFLTESDFIQIGYSSGLSGYDGGVKVTPEADIESFFFKNITFFYFKRDGMFIPYFIREKLRKKGVVKLERVSGREEALHLTDQPFYLRKRDLPDKVLKILYRHPELLFLTGFQIFDETSEKVVGIIEKVEEYPGGWMASIRDGEAEFLIPLAAPLISEIDEEEEVLYMKLPDGLLEI